MCVRVSWLPGDLPGRLGLTFAPGKRSTSKYGGHRWHRCLEADLARLIGYAGCQVLVCLLEDHELKRYGSPELLDEARARGMTVLRLPIPDCGVLPELGPVQTLLDQIASHLKICPQIG